MLTRYLVDDLVDRFYPNHFNTQMHTYYCGEIFYMLLDTLNWKVRMRMSRDNAYSWAEQDPTNAPDHWDQLTPPPFNNPGLYVGLAMCVHGSVIWVAYAQAGTANIVFKPFDMVAHTWGAETIALSGTPPFFAGQASANRNQNIFIVMDANAKLHVLYKEIEHVGLHVYERPAYQTYDTASSAWSPQQFMGDSAGVTHSVWPTGILLDSNGTIHFMLNQSHVLFVFPGPSISNSNDVCHQSLTAAGVLSAMQIIVVDCGLLADPMFCLWHQAATGKQFLIGIYLRLISPWPTNVYADQNHLGYMVAEIAEVPVWTDGEATYYNNPLNYGSQSIAGSGASASVGCLIPSPDYVYAVWPSPTGFNYNLYTRRWDGSSWSGMAAVPARNRILVNHNLKAGIDPDKHGRMTMIRGGYVAGLGYGILFMDEPGRASIAGTFTQLWHLFFQITEDAQPVRKLANYTTGGSGSLRIAGGGVPGAGIGMVLDGN